MTMTFEQFRAALGKGTARRDIGIEMSDAEATRVLSDANLANAYYVSWSAQQRTAYTLTDPMLSALSTPSPAVVTLEVAPKAKRRGYLLAIALIIVMVVVAVFLASQMAADAGAERSSAAQNAAENTALPNQAGEQDEAAREDGWAVADSGNLYIKIMKGPDTLTCGSIPCLWYEVKSINGCPSGVYIKADILRNDIAFDWTNARTASIKPGETVQVKLQTTERNTSFRPTEVSCL